MMRSFFLCVVYILTFSSALCVGAFSVRRVIAVFRHGDRTPLFPTFPTDSNFNYTWEEGSGNLTSLGRFQSFQLGAYLRRRYENLLTDDINEVYSSSSSTPRCITTTSCVLTGLYKAQEPEYCFVRQRSPPEMINTSVDYMLYIGESCPAKEKEFWKSLTNSNIKKYFLDNKKFIETLEEKSGLKILKNDSGAMVYLATLYDNLFIQKVHNVSWEDWVEPMWKDLKSGAKYLFDALLLTEREKQLQSGFLLKDIIDRLQEDGGHKLYLYGTHDFFLKALMKVIGVDNVMMPPYVATLLIELDSDAPNIRLFYRNSTTEPPYPLIVPGCGKACPLEHVIQLTKKFVLTNVEEECQLKKEKN